jgi:hypothetical protein
MGLRGWRAAKVRVVRRLESSGDRGTVTRILTTKETSQAKGDVAQQEPCQAALQLFCRPPPARPNPGVEAAGTVDVVHNGMR